MKKEEILKIVESTAISVAASFPVLSSLATGWNEYKNHVQSKNIKFILDVFFDNLKRVESKVDQNYLETEEFKSLIVKTCFVGKEEVSEEKKKYLAHFLANSTTKEHSKQSIKNTVLETILKLTPFDISVLQIINDQTRLNWEYSEYNYQPDDSNWRTIPEKEIIQTFPSVRVMDVITTIDYLNVNGVIENLSSRNISKFRNVEIREAVVKNKIEDLERERSELQMNNLFTDSKEEIFNNTEKELRDKLSYASTYDDTQYQKHYNISALGIRVLSYIISP